MKRLECFVDDASAELQYSVCRNNEVEDVEGVNS